ncbi:MAG TPA: enoyl-CoA hydratase/isomerase family protein [Pseudolabrys sp.]|nr:enoyl-CoA hydratase/isomerase family protein [Pseudolabrys sp.]
MKHIEEARVRDAKITFENAGLSPKAGAAWKRPRFTGSYNRDVAAAAKYWRDGAAFISKLPKKPHRNQAQQIAAAIIYGGMRDSRERFLPLHIDKIYRRLTKNLSEHKRVDELCYDAAKLIPGLTPTKKQVEADSGLQGEKDGVAIDQGIFLAHALADVGTGMHLCHAMLKPKMEAIELGAKFVRDDLIDFGPARVERKGKAAIVTIQNPRYLNAEDAYTLADTETAADLAIFDPMSEICVLRGGKVDHPKYKDRDVFCAGINLTHLYRGMIPYLWYIERDMGIVNKMFRGVAFGPNGPDEIYGGTKEKPWVCQLGTFAIGGGCQYLLAMDYVVAGSDAYMTLPARKEGIIPGAANLRLTRFVGARAARQAIMMDRRFDCDTPEGRLICDVIAPPAELEQAVMKVVDDFASSGVVSAAGNRRAMRVSEEPLDLFRRYMAVYCREQAYCHYSPALIANLEKHWNAANRKI